jgi:hypothetical protein
MAVDYGAWHEMSEWFEDGWRNVRLASPEEVLLHHPAGFVPGPTEQWLRNQGKIFRVRETNQLSVRLDGCPLYEIHPEDRGIIEARPGQGVCIHQIQAD